MRLGYPKNQNNCIHRVSLYTSQPLECDEYVRQFVCVNSAKTLSEILAAIPDFYADGLRNIVINYVPYRVDIFLGPSTVLVPG